MFMPIYLELLKQATTEQLSTTTTILYADVNTVQNALLQQVTPKLQSWPKILNFFNELCERG